jgi:hypothetical protein
LPVFHANPYPAELSAPYIISLICLFAIQFKKSALLFNCNNSANVCINYSNILYVGGNLGYL